MIDVADTLPSGSALQRCKCHLQVCLYDQGDKYRTLEYQAQYISSSISGVELSNHDSLIHTM